MICFVILHYQAIEETMNCIKSIKENVTEEQKIIIVDNASPNNTGEYLRKKYFGSEDVIVVTLEENVGFAKGNNIGYREAKKFRPEFIVVLNSDTLLTENTFVDELRLAYNKYKFDVLGPDIYSTKTNSHQNPQREKNYSLTELKKLRKKLYIKHKFKFLLKLKYLVVKRVKESITNGQLYQTVQQGVVLHGAFYIFSSKFIEKYNICFYNDTFMYFESYILHYLGMKEKMRFLYYPYIRVIHHEDASTELKYKGQYKKSCFVNACLLDSCKIFINLMSSGTVGNWLDNK